MSMTLLSHLLLRNFLFNEQSGIHSRIVRSGSRGRMFTQYLHGQFSNMAGFQFCYSVLQSRHGGYQAISECLAGRIQLCLDALNPFIQRRYRRSSLFSVLRYTTGSSGIDGRTARAHPQPSNRFANRFPGSTVLLSILRLWV